MMLPLEFYLAIKTPLSFALLTSMVGTLIGDSQKLWSLILKLGFMLGLSLVCAQFFFCIKVAASYLFKTPICIVCTPLAHEDSSFLWFRALWHTRFFRYFRGLTNLCLSPQKVPSFNQLSWLSCFSWWVVSPLFWMFWCLYHLIVVHERFCFLLVITRLFGLFAP